jgi:glycosyltransferase involved in cell wall biosynthesis
MKLLFVTNLCPHYRVKTFETLAARVPTRFVFFSQGGEKYWNQDLHGRRSGDFPHEYLSGFSLGPVRITPSLIARVWRTEADVILKCITGRFALPVTYLLARLRGKPFVLWTGIWSHPATLFHRLTFPLTRYLYTHADAIAVYGPHVQAYLISLGVKAERIFIAWHAADNAVYSRPVSDAERAGLHAKLDLPPEARVLLYVGRLDPVKGLPDLLAAAGQLTPLRPVVVFVGTGELREALAAQAQALGVPTRFIGYVPTAELYRYYAAADVFVLPSVTTIAVKELWGLAVNEAMNQGVPVVVSDAVGAGAGGLVRNEETGLVVPERNPAALAAALRRLLTEAEFARRLGEAGRREVALWTNERMVGGFIAAAEFAARPAGR